MALLDVHLAAVEDADAGHGLERLVQVRDAARQALDRAAPAPALPWTQTFPLGPTLGQCCGGTVRLAFAPLDDASLAAWTLPLPRFHLELHGAGHVGQAIARLLADVDCSVRWIDERPGEAEALDTAPAAIGLPTAQALAALPDHIQFLPTDAADAEVVRVVGIDRDHHEERARHAGRGVG